MAEQKERMLVFPTGSFQKISRQGQETSIFRATACGIRQCAPGERLGRLPAPGCSLYIVMSGYATVTIEGRMYAVCAGQMFLVRENETAQYRTDDREPSSYAWIDLAGEIAGKILDCAGFTEHVHVLDCCIDPQAFVDVVEEIMKKPEPDLSSEFMRQSLALRFLSYAVNSWETIGRSEGRAAGRFTADEYVERAVRYIQENYAHLRIREVADYIGLSRSYFADIFKKKKHLSPQAFLMQIRMDQAKKLLEQTELPVAVIAAAVGYEDQLAFSKLFRKKHGISPEQYRKREQTDVSGL